MAKKIKGNHDGPNGGNDSYTIHGRGVVPRDIVVSEVESGKHPNFTTTEINGEKYVKGKPDDTTNNNVND